MDININDVVAKCLNEINEKVKNLKRLNIIIAGKTGVGKSTLINYIFREQLAETGIGRPVTQHMREISKKDFPLTIYDTKGFELGKDVQEEIKKEIIGKIKEGLYSKDENKCIHCIWYCINTVSDRVEDEEIEWLRALSAENRETKVPIIIVLTKSFSKKKAAELRSYIENLNLDVCAIIPVLALDYPIDDEFVVSAYGGEHLITVMGEALGDELIPTLQNVQRIAIREKVKFSRGIVATSIAAAFTEGFIPLPFADAAALIPTQITMLASITAAFGVKVDSKVLLSFLTGVLGTAGNTFLGRAIASNLLKLIPFAGSAIGGTISGGTAALLTGALGEAYIKLLEKMALGELRQDKLTGKEIMTEMREIFKKELQTLKKDGKQSILPKPFSRKEEE